MNTSAAQGEIQLHPMNRGFNWNEPPMLPPRRLSSESIRQFDQQGFFKLESVFNRTELDAVTAAIDPLEQAQEHHVRAQGGVLRLSAADVITFTIHLTAKSQTLRNFARHRVFVDVCHDLIGQDVRLYWDQSVYKKSGKPQEFPWHQDNGYTFIEPQQYVTFWVPLVDVDIENGCPWIAPGLHKLGTLLHWPTPLGFRCLEDVPDAVPVPAHAGDVIVFSSLAPHRTGPNLVPGSVRKAYVLQYAPEGAVAYRGDGPPQLQNDPDRQFKVLENGREL